MSTGIVSVIFFRTGWFDLSHLFLIIGTVFYIGLIALFMARLFLLRSKVLQDFEDIQKMFKSSNFSAGSNVLAVSFCLSGYNQIGLALGIVGTFSQFS